jgi:glycosyltransferase involved in cell wall biosynthesis
MNKYLVSIISVTYRPGSSFLKTVKSILALKSKQVEFIVIDGGSGPEFLSMMEPYQSEIETFVSENDNGIYDAMNKGWDRAQGKYLLFINDGDELLWLPVSDLQNSSAQVVLGSVMLSGDNLMKPVNSQNISLRNTWPHQGTFYSRNLPHRYATEYKVFSDFDLNLKLKNGGIPIEVIRDSRPIAFHETNGISHQKESLPEFYRIITKHHGRLAAGCAFLNFKIMGLKARILPT